jgi:hypothetical protein
MIGRVLILCAALGACTPSGEPPELPPPPDPPAPAVTADIPAQPADIVVKMPAVRARVTSPLIVEGAAINTFFFEGVFPAELVVDGKVVAEAPAEQQAPTNWTEPGPVNFKATLPFDVSKETNAEIVLREDMPAGDDPASDVSGPARTVRIPVVLVPAS